MSAAAWEVCLERLAHQLAQQRAAVGSGDLDALQPFSVDEELGPLPVELRDRALRLHAECQALAEQLAASRDRTAQDLAGLLRPRTGASASYVDSHV